MAINIGSAGKSLRLRWTHEGERYTLSLGLKDTKTNRIKAKDVILLIEADIENNEFDTTLNKYRPEKELAEKPSCLELFQKWLGFKSKFVDVRTIEWYELTQKKLVNIGLGNTVADNVTHSQAIHFLTKLQDQELAIGTIRRHMENMRACWEWGVRRRLIKDSNPWDELVPLIKVPAEPMPHPFTKPEVNLIIDGFEEFYPGLVPFVRFLFGTGCRTGEARALKWECLDKTCSRCEINGQLSRRGNRKATKNNKIRTLILPASLSQTLADMRRPNSSGYVFLFNNKPIKDDGFRHRWERVLKKKAIAYRCPYNTRATFISHALEKGLSPLTIASQTGHNVRVLFDHYAGSLQNNPKLPEMF